MPGPASAGQIIGKEGDDGPIEHAGHDGPAWLSS
jgi:hypothetical protein